MTSLMYEIILLTDKTRKRKRHDFRANGFFIRSLVITHDGKRFNGGMHKIAHEHNHVEDVRYAAQQYMDTNRHNNVVMRYY